MKFRFLLSVLAAAACGPLYAGSASAPTDGQRAAALEHWKQMTPEEQAAAKAKAKAKWDAMTPEEQAAAKQKFAQKHPDAAKRMEAKHAAAASAPAAAPAPAK